MKLREAQSQFALDVAKLIMFINQSGMSVTIGEVYRTPEQAALNEEKGLGVADSLHCKRLAIDLNLFNGDEYLTHSEDYREFGLFWISLNKNNRWGGNWKKRDGNHFERKED